MSAYRRTSPVSTWHTSFAFSDSVSSGTVRRPLSDRPGSADSTGPHAFAAPLDQATNERLVTGVGWLFCTLVTIVCLLAIGCSGHDPIRTYEVAKSAAGPNDRMLAAILPRGEQAWFFKLTGPTGPVGDVSEPFREFIHSVRFENDEPVWELADGWQVAPGNAMRFATIEITTEGDPLEMSVTTLPLRADDLTAYVLANVNRWRGQLGLAPVAAAELSEATEGVEIDGNPAWLVNMEGRMSGGGMSGGGMGAPPFAGGGSMPRPPAAGPAGPSSRATTGRSPPALAFAVPEGWEESATDSSRGGFSIPREAVFTVRDGDQQVEISVTRLGGDGGGVIPNVNRWRQQVGLAAADPSAAETELDELEFAGEPADYAVLIGPDQAILGVIAQRDGSSWFVKLQGDAALAERQRQNFESFVRSIQFNQ